MRRGGKVYLLIGSGELRVSWVDIPLAAAKTGVKRVSQVPTHLHCWYTSKLNRHALYLPKAVTRGNHLPYVRGAGCRRKPLGTTGSTA